MAAGGLKGSFYEGMPDSMKPKAKEKRPLNNINHKRLDQLRARRTHAHPPPPAHRTLGRRPYAACDGLCWQFRHCLVAGTNRKLHVCPGRYGIVVGSRVRGRSRDG